MQYEQPFPDNRLRKAYSEQRVPHVTRIRIRPHWTISEDAKDVEQQMPVLLKLLSGIYEQGSLSKACVASGALFGTISGSAVANVVASGMVTIPMMRKVGYDRPTAGAIEATSSTGGQMTPPVLGAGAFLMAEITGIPYGEIALAAVLPALLFYVACWIHVDYHAIRLGLRGLSRAELPPLNRMLVMLYLFAPIITLVWALIEGYSPFRAGGLGILVALVAGWLARVFRDMNASGATAKVADSVLGVASALLLRAVVLVVAMGALYGATVYGFRVISGQFGEWAGFALAMAMILVPALLFGWKRTLDGLNLAARDTIQLVAVCAVAGIIVGVVALTGIGGRFSELILGIAGAFLATFIGQAIGHYGPDQGAGFVTATIGALVVLFIWNRLVAARVISDPGSK